MSQFLQILLSGLATGAIYALVAIGFTLVWQAAQTVNFAQGEFVMLPAFFVLVGTHTLHLPLWIALAIGLAASILVLGLAFKKVVVDPILPSGGISLILRLPNRFRKPRTSNNRFLGWLTLKIAE